MQLNPEGDFQSWILSPAEQERGFSFNQEQRAVLQNLKAAAAREILDYVVSPVTGTDQDKFAQAVLRGQIQIIDMLLSGTVAETSSTQTNEE